MPAAEIVRTSPRSVYAKLLLDDGPGVVLESVERRRHRLSTVVSVDMSRTHRSESILDAGPRQPGDALHDVQNRLRQYKRNQIASTVGDDRALQNRPSRPDFGRDEVQVESLDGVLFRDCFAAVGVSFPVGVCDGVKPDKSRLYYSTFSQKFSSPGVCK